jgi:hypothetical protein
MLIDCNTLTYNKNVKSFPNKLHIKFHRNIVPGGNTVAVRSVSPRSK